jgi:hypothetical protein
MATGNIKWFQQAVLDLGRKIHDLSADALQVGIITSAVAPAMNTAGPHWGGTGTTNFASNQVSTGGGYTGPIALASVTWTIVAGVPTLRAADVPIPQNAAGFADGAYAIIFNNTDANKRAIAFIELSAAGGISIVSGSFTIDFQGAGTDVLSITPS